MNTTNDPSQIRRQERRARAFWIAFVLMFFMIQATIWTVAISITANDRSHAVVPDYDQKALQWNDQRQRQDASRQLGWAARWEVEPVAAKLDAARVELRLTDVNEQPVTGAQVELVVFHCAIASEPQTVSLVESEPGKYSGGMIVTRGGLWQFDGVAQRGDQSRLLNQRIEIPVGF